MFRLCIPEIFCKNFNICSNSVSVDDAEKSFFSPSISKIFWFVGDATNRGISFTDETMTDKLKILEDWESLIWTIHEASPK